MKHKHKYEPFYHPSVSPEAKNLGIKALEIRKCSLCNKEMIYLLIKGDKWIPLFADDELDKKDILLA